MNVDVTKVDEMFVGVTLMIVGGGGDIRVKVGKSTHRRVVDRYM